MNAREDECDENDAGGDRNAIGWQVNESDSERGSDRGDSDAEEGRGGAQSGAELGLFAARGGFARDGDGVGCVADGALCDAVGVSGDEAGFVRHEIMAGVGCAGWNEVVRCSGVVEAYKARRGVHSQRGGAINEEGHTLYSMAPVSPKTLYFIGNIFNTEDEPATYADQGYAFSDAEIAELDLVGLPIQVEHDANLSVGTILRSWYESDGRRWILGAIDRGDVDGVFAASAVTSKLYTGLSLQHISYEMRDGSITKVPVEVSICQTPRREDCLVRHHTASAKTPYNRLCEQWMQMTSQELAPSADGPSSVAAVTAVTDVTAVTAVPAALSPAPVPAGLTDSTELMRMLVTMEGEKAAAEEQLARMSERVASHEASVRAEEESRTREQRTKLEGISNDLKGWCATNGFELTAERVERIHDLVANHSASAEVLFEIAHCASAKHVEATREVKAQAARMKTESLQARVDTIIKQRQNAAGPVTTHVASAGGVGSASEPNPYATSARVGVKRPLSPRFVRNGVPPSQLLDAIKRQRASCTGHDAARSIYADISSRR